MKHFYGHLTLVVMIMLAVCMGCRGNQATADPADMKSDEIVYLKNNIHAQYQQRGDVTIYRASYANYTQPGNGHVIIAVNTPVVVDRSKGFSGQYIKILDTRSNKLISMEFNPKRMNMTAAEYIDLITSPAPVSLDALSDIDRKGIADGKAYVGMSKAGVMHALGYPAAHKTPSPDADVWEYWTNRFHSFRIQFGPDGTVKQIGGRTQ